MRVRRSYRRPNKSQFVEMFGDTYSNSKNWTRKLLKDICTVRQGLQIPIAKRLTERDSKGDCFEYITVAYLHGTKQREYIKNPKQSVICTEEDILMTRTGNTGMVVSGVRGVFHNNFFLIDYDKSLLNRTFMISYLNDPYVQSEIKRLAGTSTIPDLNHGDFYKIGIYLPPLALQQEFAAFVEKVDKLAFAVRKGLEATERLYRQQLSEAFS